MPPVELNVLGDKLSGYIWWQMLEAFLRKRYPQIEPHEFRSAEPEEVGQMLSRRVAWIPDPGRSSTPPQTLNEFLLNINLFKQPHSSETRSLRAQVDTGAAPLFMNLTKAEELGFKLEPYYDKEIIAVNDKPIEIFSTTRQAWYPEGGRQVMWDDFLVVKDLPFDVVVGRERWHEVKGHLSGGVLAEAERKGFRLGWLIGCLFICLVLIYVPRSWLLALAHKILPGGMRHAPSTDMMAFLIAATLFVEACLCPFLQRPELVFDVPLTQRYGQPRFGYQQSQYSPYIQQTAMIPGIPTHSKTFSYPTPYTRYPYEQYPYEQQSASYGLIRPTSSVSTGNSEFERIQGQWTWSAAYNRYYRVYTDQRGQTIYEWAPPNYS